MLEDTSSFGSPTVNTLSDPYVASISTGPLGTGGSVPAAFTNSSPIGTPLLSSDLSPSSLPSFPDTPTLDAGVSNVSSEGLNFDFAHLIASLLANTSPEAEPYTLYPPWDKEPPILCQSRRRVFFVEENTHDPYGDNLFALDEDLGLSPSHDVVTQNNQQDPEFINNDNIFSHLEHDHTAFDDLDGPYTV